MDLPASPERRYTLAGVLLALFLGALDQTIVATALPRIVADLQGLDRYAWIVTIYLLTFTVATPIYGKLADIYNRKAVELGAIGLFLGGSFLCGLAGEFGVLPFLGDGMNQLIAFRALQGLGGGGLFSLAFIIIADLFPPAERGRYQGLVGAVFALASVLGPFIGGVLTDHGDVLIPGIEGWRWVFYVNLPFGLLALGFIWRKMPPLHPLTTHRRLDWYSMLLFSGALGALVLALQLDKKAHSWEAPETIGLFVVAALLLGLFGWQARRSPSPVLDLDLFRERVFTTSGLALFLMGAVFLNIVLFAPLFLINVAGVSATMAGLSMIPFSLGVAMGSTISGQLVARLGYYRRFMLGGELLVLGAVGLLAMLTPETHPGLLAFYLALCGLGLGPTMPLFPLAIQNAVDVRKLGQATSAAMLARQIGGVVGTAVMGTVLAVSLAAHVPKDAAAQLSFQEGQRGGLEAVQVRFDSLANRLEAALAIHNDSLLEQTLYAAPLPPTVKTRLQQIIHRDGVSEALHTAIRHEIDSAREQVLQQFRQAFTKAIVLIYRYVLVLVGAALVVTWFVPELPLRRTYT